MEEVFCGMDDMIDGEILAWAEIGDVWEDSGLYQWASALSDIAYDCTLLEIESEGSDAPMLSGTAYVGFAEDPVAARKEFRSVLARFILDNKAFIRESRTPSIDHDLIQRIVNDIYTNSPASTAEPTYPHPESVEVDHWLKKPSKPIPRTAEEILLVEMDFHVATYDVRLYFRRTRKKDELWSDPEYGGTGCVVSCLKHGKPLEGALRVLGIHLASMGGFSGAKCIEERGTRLDGHGDALRQALVDAV